MSRSPLADAFTDSQLVKVLLLACSMTCPAETARRTIQEALRAVVVFSER